MPDTPESRIFDYLNRPGYKPLKAKELLKKLGVKKKTVAEYKAALESLMETGRVKSGKNGLLRLRALPGMVTGIVKRTGSGAGYVVPHEAVGGDRSADVYIAPKDMSDAHSGDEVLVRLLKRVREGGQRCGRIEEIVARATSTFVGTYLERDGEGYVRIDGSAFNEAVYVGDPGAKGAQPDDKVVVEMLRFPSQFHVGEAVVTRVLGPRGEPGIDLLSIIHEFGLPDEFPEEVLADARLQAERFDETDLEGRLDLTRETIVTIDPVDARDFDDAISLTREANGHWRLGVHIADVSHFVQPGSPLDHEAYNRGTSVYLPGRVLPMLPEVISNGLASLQQGRVRYTKSVFIEFTGEGIPVHTAFANSAVKVTRRFAYEEVMPILHEPERYKTRVSAKIRKLLADMHELAMILRARRFAKGALEMSLPEVKLDFDKEGRVVGAHEQPHDESHQIIEEFMLAANCAVATELDDRAIAFLRRVHGDPDEAKLRAFSQFVTALGFPLKQFQSRLHLQKLLDEVKGEPPEHAVNYALLRSMKQAEYTGVEMGHYALAVDDYCHFTSPIRRYPDLTVHRLVAALVEGAQRPGGPNEVELIKIGKLCSGTERRAAAAERELVKVKLLTFMEERIGYELDAVITGVERFGFFCQGIELPVEGLVHVSWLSDEDYFYYDAVTFSLIGRRSGRQYRLGDRVRVRVAHVDVDRRELDFRVVGPASFSEDGRRRRKKSADSVGDEVRPARAKTKGRKPRARSESAGEREGRRAGKKRRR